MADRAALSVAAVRTNLRTGAAWCAYDPDIYVTTFEVVRGASVIDLEFVSYVGNTMQRHWFGASVIAVDAAHDLALLQLDEARHAPFFIRSFVPPLAMATAPPRVGSAAVAFGAQPTQGPPAIQHLAAGAVSLADREADHRLLCTAALGPADAGGPITDGEGVVVGVSTAGPAEGGMCAAIPVRFVRILHALRDTAFKVDGPLSEWESRPRQTAVGLVAMLPDRVSCLLAPAAGAEIWALSQDGNALLALSTATQGVSSRIILPSGPSRMVPGEVPGQVWVESRLARAFTLVDLHAHALVAILHARQEPSGFTVTRHHLWYTTQEGRLNAINREGTHVETSMVGMAVAPLEILARPSTGPDVLWCDDRDGTLCEFAAGAFLALQPDSSRQQPSADPSAMEYRGYLEASTLRSGWGRYAKTLYSLTERPQYRPGAESLAALLSDPAHDRLYLESVMLALAHPDHIIGTFVTPALDQTTVQPGQNAIVPPIPLLTGVQCWSPDGRFAATGRAVFRTDDCTLVLVLPRSATAASFAPDSCSIYVADLSSGAVLALALPAAPPPPRPADAAPGQARAP